MDIRPEPIELPASISRLLIETVSSKMGLGGRDPQAALDKLPASLPEGEVTRLAQGGPFGWLLDARVDRVDGRVALELCENSRMTGMAHYRVWEDGSVEQLETELLGVVFPPDCSDEERTRLQREYFAHNRAVHDLLRERGFR